MRTHVVIPEELVKEVDALVGPRQRSKFFTDAAQEKLKQKKRVAAVIKAAGSLKDVDIPGWETSRSAAKWVSKNRKDADRNLSW